jgi:Tfp pilus assembly protein PilF
MKKNLLIVSGAAIFVFMSVFFMLNLNKGSCPLITRPVGITSVGTRRDSGLDEAFELLRIRKDKDALIIFEQILLFDPGNIDAQWGKAEVLRRIRNFSEAAKILNDILKERPGYPPAMISLAYIKYKDAKLKEARQLINEVIKTKPPRKEELALAYTMLGSINSRLAGQGWLLNKIKYSTQIKRYFVSAKELAPDLPEVRLGLGTFYLLAPSFIGGNLDKAIDELKKCVEIAPDFATANARLAQAYQRKGVADKSLFYKNKARQLDPENEALREF